MPLTCKKCPVSSLMPGKNAERWCDAKRMTVSAISECYYPTVDAMVGAQIWYSGLAKRLEKAIAMREAEERG